MKNKIGILIEQGVLRLQNSAELFQSFFILQS